MKIFGIRFAPLFIPLHRRIETLSAFTVLFMLTYSMVVSLFITIALLFSPFCWLIVLYIIWIIKDRKIGERGGRPNKWVQSWKIFQYARQYYPVTVTIVPGLKLDPKRNYISCSFPHGLFPTGVFMAFAHDTPERRTLFSNHSLSPITLSTNFFVPFYREFMLSLGFCNANRKSISYILQTANGGRIAALMVGGAAESQYAYGGQYCLVLKNRKGFIKLALEHGSPLIPIFSFGETTLFNQLVFPEGSRLRRFQDWFRKTTGIAPNIVYGRGFFQYTFGILPFRNPINVVVGPPVEVKKIIHPTKQDVDELHQKFIDALTNLFEEYKYKFERNPSTIHLSIV